MNRRALRLALTAVALAAALAGGARDVRAFPGFYSSDGAAKLTNTTTQVVVMRDRTLTVLSIQPNYQGPAHDFAMVIPVPVVLQKENVKTLAPEVFDRVDRLTAPRLVEYWEKDPCPKPTASSLEVGKRRPRPTVPASSRGVPVQALPDVRLEAQFSAREYDIVILSAADAASLERWLADNHFSIPDGAGPYLRPYVQMGMKFLVARVDVSKVRFERIGNGPAQAVLSPLRLHYDSEVFSLPVRLGLINSGGTQDLIVTILARQ
jgi:hypothetical protein